MIKCIVIDDEQPAIKTISEFIKNIPKINLLDSFTNPMDALNYMKKADDIDLAFMDVDMPLISGIKLAELTRAKIKKMVFTTSHSKYALDAFKVNADDFLLKPFDFSDFLRTIEKLYPDDHAVKTERSEKDNFLYIKNKEDDLRLIKVYFSDIVAIESLLNYVRVHTVSKKLVTHISLKDVKEVLNERHEFVQLHRSFILSKHHISMIDGNTLTMSNGAKFTTGDSYRDILNEILVKNILKPVQKK